MLDSHVTGCQGPGAPLRGHLLGSHQEGLGEQLEGAGDDDGDRGGHLAHLLVTLHDLLDPSLQSGSRSVPNLTVN